MQQGVNIKSLRSNSRLECNLTKIPADLAPPSRYAVQNAESGLTEFAQAMPDEYKCLGDAVKAYKYEMEAEADNTWVYGREKDPIDRLLAKFQEATKDEAGIKRLIENADDDLLE